MMAGLIAPALLLAAAAPASAMDVQTFLAKADALQKKGPLALFSADFKLLKSQVKADAEIRKERLTAEAAGRATAFCPPAGGINMAA